MTLTYMPQNAATRRGEDNQDAVYSVIDGPVGWLYLNRPAKKNALTAAMWKAVAREVEKLSADTSVRAIVLTSSTSGVFASGIDLQELQEIAANPALRDENRQAVRAAQRGLALSPKPTLALIDGPCVGGGCGLALHCDFRFASEHATFGITPARIGLIYPLSDMKRLMDVAGDRAARRLLLTAEIIDGAEALRLGIIDTLLPLEALKEAVLKRLKAVCCLSPASMRRIKADLQRVADGLSDDTPETITAFLAAHESADATEGIRAFLEKRKAIFKSD